MKLKRQKDGIELRVRYIIDIQYDNNDEFESDVFLTPSMFQRDLEDFLYDNEYSWDKKHRIRVQDEYCIEKELTKLKKGVMPIAI